MPFIINMVRRYVLVAVALPLAGKLLGAIANRVRTSRGDGHLTKVLDKASSAASSRGRRGGR